MSLDVKIPEFSSEDWEKIEKRVREVAAIVNYDSAIEVIGINGDQVDYVIYEPSGCGCCEDMEQYDSVKVSDLYLSDKELESR